MNETATEKSTVELPEVFTLASVTELKTTLDASITNNDVIHVDASKVERVDGVALQLLFHSSRLLVKKPDDFVLLQPSEILQDALKVMGMEGLLGADNSQDNAHTDADTKSASTIESSQA